MKIFSFLIMTIGISPITSGQVETAKPYSDSVRTRIQKEVEAEAVEFEQNLNKEYMTSEQIHFCVDTFKVYATNRKRQDFDFSIEGMNNSVIEMTTFYDKLLNLYYNKLLKRLNSKDKKILISSQNEWIKFRDLEKKLIWTMTQEKYNIGGAIQTELANSRYFDLIQQRTDQIFNYYNSIMEKDELGKASR